MKPVKLAAAPKLLTQPNGGIDPSRLALIGTLFEWPGHVGQPEQPA